MRPITLLLALAATLTTLPACSTRAWYASSQLVQQNQCEKLSNFEDRRRCNAEAGMDKERYDKERKAAAGAP